MGRKITPGLRKRGEFWHVEKTIKGVRLFESTGERELEKAEIYLAKRIEEIRRETVYGVRRKRTFQEAAAKYLEDHPDKRSLRRDAESLKALMPFLGDLELDRVHAGTLEPFLVSRRKAGLSAGTINRDLAIVRRILNLAARLWRDEEGRPWLDSSPMLAPVKGEQRKPRPISWSEQTQLLKELPGYLADMVLFALHTGLRDQELCGLRWSWEHRVSGLETTVFVIPEYEAKNGRERIVPLNAVTRSIIEARRGHGTEWVFALDGKRLSRMNNKAWRKARQAAGLEEVRVHDLRHTFGMRLRAAGVSLEDRQDLLGHYAGRITTHYSRVEIARLIECVELLCGDERRPEVTLLRRV
jgi:integrase